MSYKSYRASVVSSTLALLVGSVVMVHAAGVRPRMLPLDPRTQVLVPRGLRTQSLSCNEWERPWLVTLTSFFLSHGEEVPQPQTIFSTFVGKRAFSVPE